MFSLLRRVHFHGPLRATLDGPIEITGDTVFEVLEGITRQLPQFAPNPVTGRHRLQVVGCRTIEDLHRMLDGGEIDIHVVPLMTGGKSTSVQQIIVGTILIGVSFIPGIAGTPLQGWLIKMGSLQILGGVIGMLSPAPADDNGEKTRSQYLGAPRNTTKIGTRIPVLYGEYRWGGHYLSFDINAIEFRSRALDEAGSMGSK
jgi:predicted phage tail protein